MYQIFGKMTMDVEEMPYEFYQSDNLIICASVWFFKILIFKNLYIFNIFKIIFIFFINFKVISGIFKISPEGIKFQKITTSFI